MSGPMMVVIRGKELGRHAFGRSTPMKKHRAKPDTQRRRDEWKRLLALGRRCAQIARKYRRDVRLRAETALKELKEMEAMNNHG